MATNSVYLDNEAGYLKADYTASSGTMAIAGSDYTTGYGAFIAAELARLGFPAVSAINPLGFTLYPQSAFVNGTLVVVRSTPTTEYQATGISGDNLTGVTAVNGTTDRNWASGSILGFFFRAGDILQLQTAIANASTPPGGTAGQVQFNSGGTAFGGFAVSGDGSLNTSTGALTVTKSSGTSFGSAAFQPTSAFDAAGAAAAALTSANSYTNSALTSYAPLASPALTGAPTAPTATAGTNTTQVATTAFVQSSLPGVFVASGSSHAKGLVPDPGSTAGTARYLREDATWQAVTVSLAGSGSYSTQAGSGSNASGYATLAIGYNASASGSCAMAFGTSVTVSANYTVQFGNTYTPINVLICSGTSAGFTLAPLSASSANVGRNCGYFQTGFVSSTDASWTGYASVSAGDYTSSNLAIRTGIMVGSNGAAVTLGFGAKATTSTLTTIPTLSYSRSGASETPAVAAIRSALATLGLVVDSTTT